MKKSTYLIISGILSFGFLQNNLLSDRIEDILFSAMLLWCLFGYIYYRNAGYLNIKKNRRWVNWLFFLFFLSSLTPIVQYNQSLILTWVAMRTNLLIIYLLTLLKIAPQEEDFFKSFRFLGILAIIISIFVYLKPDWFVEQKRIDILTSEQIKGSKDLIVTWPGSACAIIYFYILLQITIDHSRPKDIIKLTLFMTYIFLMQNRSTLICAAPFYIYAILKCKSSIFKWSIMIGIIMVGSAYIYEIIQNLLEETQEQLSNANYNRWQAISFFLLEQKNDLYTILFGHGVPAQGSEYLKYVLRAQNDRYAFISDIGLLGTYFYYGVTILIVIYRFVLIAIFDSRIPRYVRYYAIWILLIPTIHIFGLGSIGSMIQFMTLFYWVIYYQHNNKQNQVSLQINI